jgi:hypothetical protein
MLQGSRQWSKSLDSLAPIRGTPDSPSAVKTILPAQSQGRQSRHTREFLTAPSMLIVAQDDNSMNAGCQKQDTRFDKCANHQGDFTASIQDGNPVRQTNTYSPPARSILHPESRRS